MKVKDLKTILNNFHSNDLVILSSDEEGNTYSRLSDYYPAYIPKNEEEQQYMTDDEIFFEGSEEDETLGNTKKRKTQKCIVLFP